MNLTSSAFIDNALFPQKYTNGINPPLSISNVSSDAKSLALVFHDPDAVSGDYIHWILWNIEPTTTCVLEDTLPAGSVEGVTSAGTTGYVSPQPPRGSGRHHYTFELFALDRKLDLPAATFYADILKEINNHKVATAKLTSIIDARPQ